MLSASIAKAVDSAIVFGTGIGAIPKGLNARTGANGDVQTAAFPTTWQSVLAVEQQLSGANVTPNGWLASTAGMTTLRGTLKEAGLPGYIATADKIGDLPAAATNQLAGNFAVLGDWTQILLGQWGDAVEITVNPYAEGPFRRGAVLVRAWSTIDVQCRHEQAFVIASTP
jgi:HK97 family phage major capsid protein